MIDEWAGTPWAGTTVAEAVPSGTDVVPTGTTGHNVRMMAKATAYDGNVIWTPDRLPISWAMGSPLKRMREEQAAYWINPWILAAENAVTRRVRGLPWHLEDGNEETVDDESNSPLLRAIRKVLEKPQAALPEEERQVGIQSWTNLISITSRHLGLCGMTHWYKDQMDSTGFPAAILYVNPARLYPITTTTGHLVEWSLDPKDDQGNGGTRLRRDQILTFYLAPPDGGVFVSGLVQAARLKAQLSQMADTHALNVFGNGGRQGGFLSPKSGMLGPDEYKTLEQEARNLEDAPDAAKRLKVVKGPIDFTPTVQNMQELDLTGISELARDDIFTIWGVPASQAPISIAAGLNSGTTKGYDEAILYQGAVHDRVVPISETIQFGLLDLVAAEPQIVIEEPSFDDDTPAYSLANTAVQQPLTRNERRHLLNLDPLPDYGPDGEPLGIAIDLPANIVTVAQGEETPGAQPGKFGKAPLPAPAPTPPVTLLPPNPALLPANTAEPAKAQLRTTLVTKYEPLIRRAVQGFLNEQKAEIAGRIRKNGAHLATRGGKDTDAWWSDKWDARLLEALRRGIAGISSTVTTSLKVPAKADPFADAVLGKLLRTVGKRVKGINETTRTAIAEAIQEGFEQGLSPGEVADLIEESVHFDPPRAEVIARTETGSAYNQAAVLSYQELDVTSVEVIDGDSDDECAAADGQTWSLEEALDNPLEHPNCVRDFVPVFA